MLQHLIVIFLQFPLPFYLATKLRFETKCKISLIHINNPYFQLLSVFLLDS
jgi:hypothetical protein